MPVACASFTTLGSLLAPFLSPLIPRLIDAIPAHGNRRLQPHRAVYSPRWVHSEPVQWQRIRIQADKYIFITMYSYIYVIEDDPRA